MKNLANDIVMELNKANIDAKVTEVNKNGVNKIGIVVKTATEISPIFYADEFINFNANDIADYIISQMPSAMLCVNDFNINAMLEDKEYILNNIYIGFERENDSDIVKMPSPFDGIQQYMYIRFGDEMRAKVSEQLLNGVGINETDAWINALKNTKAKACVHQEFGTLTMITNELRMFGASSALIHDTIREVCELLDSEQIALIPSSVHEFICLPYNESTNLDELSEMISSANNDVVDPIEQLGDIPYIVNKNFGF